MKQHLKPRMTEEPNEKLRKAVFQPGGGHEIDEMSLIQTQDIPYLRDATPIFHPRPENMSLS